MTDTPPKPADDEPAEDDETAPLPEDAEIEPPAEGALHESDEVLTPFPGFGAYNPIGGLSGVGAFEGTPAKDVLAGAPPGQVLLEVKAKRHHPGVLVMLLGALVLGLVAVAAFGLQTTFDPEKFGVPGRRSTSLTVWFLVAAGVLLGVGFLLDLIIATDVDVTFTSEGVAKHGKGEDAWVPWSEVQGYRIAGPRFVSLQCAGGTVPVPMARAETLDEVLKLLDGRGVKQLT